MSTRATSPPGYRLRPAPRRRSGGRPVTRLRWDRVGRIILVVAIFLVLLSYVRPAVNLFEGWSESRTEGARLERVSAENAELSSRAKALREPAVATKVAREQGLVATGERPYVVLDLGK